MTKRKWDLVWFCYGGLMLGLGLESAFDGKIALALFQGLVGSLLIVLYGSDLLHNRYEGP